MHSRALLVSIVLVAHAVPGWSQTADELANTLQSQLEERDLDMALDTADRLYQVRLSQGARADAGAAAFTKGYIYGAQNKSLESAKEYDLCDKHYAAVGSAAQSLQCRHKAGVAYSAGGKKGLALERLKSTAAELESIQQDKSGLATMVYLSLAGEILPPKFDRLNGAESERRAAITYADKAMTALSAIGQNQSDHFASALLLKATAFDDLKEYNRAVPVYEGLLALYTELPSATDEMRQKIYSRLSIARSEAGLSDDDDTVTVMDLNGEKHVLKIHQRKKVSYPKINRNQKADGAYVRAVITLKTDGEVESIDVLESEPDEKYGEAFVNAVRKWKFELPEGISGGDIQPFSYGMTFYLKRR